MLILPTKIDMLSRFINFNLLRSAYFIFVLKSNRFNLSDTNLRPRYSIDVRYYDEDLKTEFNESYLFKLKRFYNRVFG